MTRDSQCLLLCWPTILGELNEVDLPVLVKSEVKRRLKLNKTCTKCTTAWGKRGFWITYEVCDPSPWIKFFSWGLTSAASSFPSFWQLGGPRRLIWYFLPEKEEAGIKIDDFTLSSWVRSKPAFWYLHFLSCPTPFNAVQSSTGVYHFIVTQCSAIHLPAMQCSANLPPPLTAVHSAPINFSLHAALSICKDSWGKINYNGCAAFQWCIDHLTKFDYIFAFSKRTLPKALRTQPKVDRT